MIAAAACDGGKKLRLKSYVDFLPLPAKERYVKKPNLVGLRVDCLPLEVECGMPICNPSIHTRTWWVKVQLAVDE